MGLLRRLIGTASRAARPVRRRPVATRPVRTRPVATRRGSTAGGIIGAVRGFLRGSGRARI